MRTTYHAPAHAELRCSIAIVHTYMIAAVTPAQQNSKKLTATFWGGVGVVFAAVAHAQFFSLNKNGIISSLTVHNAEMM